MGEKEKTRVGFWRRKWVLLVGAVVGVVLILLGNSDLVGSWRSQESEDEVERDALLVYARELESRIEALCSHVEGVDDVHAVVSLDGDFVYIYASDSESSDREGAVERQEQYVTVGSGASAQPLLLTRRPPTIEGIGVVCRGGGDARVRQKIIALLSAAFSVGSNKIYVAEANP